MRRDEPVREVRSTCVKVHVSITRPVPLAVWLQVVFWARSEPGVIAGSDSGGLVQIQYHWQREQFVQAPYDFFCDHLFSFLSSEAKAWEATAPWGVRNYAPGWMPGPSESGGWRKRKRLINKWAVWVRNYGQKREDTPKCQAPWRQQGWSLTNAVIFSLRRACSHRPDATLFLLNYLIAVSTPALSKTAQAKSHRSISYIWNREFSPCYEPRWHLTNLCHSWSWLSLHPTSTSNRVCFGLSKGIGRSGFRRHSHTGCLKASLRQLDICF